MNSELPVFDVLAVPVSFWLLFASIVALWIKQETRAWLVLFAMSVMAALWQGYMEPVGLVSVALIALSTYIMGQKIYDTDRYRSWRAASPAKTKAILIISNISFLLVGGLLAAHKMPGFDSYAVIRGLQLHQQSPTTAIRFHFDKAIIGIFFLYFCASLVRKPSEWLLMFKQFWWMVPMTVGVAFVIGSAFGYVAFDPVYSSLFFAFIMSNLLVTSIAEEVFFRGWMQAGLMRYFAERKHGAYIALLITSTLFGAAHLWGGIGLFLGAFLAGLGYGMAYIKTGRIEAAIITHFAFNGIHFTFFTYPYLLQTP